MGKGRGRRRGGKDAGLRKGEGREGERRRERKKVRVTEMEERGSYDVEVGELRGGGGGKFGYIAEGE